MLVASAPLIPGQANDLNHSALLDFVVSYPGAWWGQPVIKPDWTYTNSFF